MTGPFALAGLLLAAGGTLPTDASALGMTAHEAVSLRIQRAAKGSLKELLDAQQDSYRNGTIFPDVAQSYLSEKVGWSLEGGYSADDLSHGAQNGKPEGFLNEYLAYLKSQCGSAYRKSESAECQQARAFFLGAVSHVVADGPWHANFIGLDKQGGSVDSLVDHCGAGAGKAHDFADSDLDICLSKRLNIGAQDVELDRTREVAVRRRKNERVGQGCPDGQWWHVGGGDGLLGACWACPEGFAHDDGKLPNEEGVCYKENIIRCSKIPSDELGVDAAELDRLSVTASALGFKVVEAGYRYAAGAYNRMNDQARARGLGGKTSWKGLVDMVNSDKYLPNLTFSQNAGKKDFVDPHYAAKCSWGLSKAAKGDGAIVESGDAAKSFVGKVWELLQDEADFAIVRFGAYNYGILKGGAVSDCVFKDAKRGCT